MALCIIRTNLYRYFKMHPKIFGQRSFKRNKTVMVDSDSLDEFTTQLMQGKMEKWNSNTFPNLAKNNSKPMYRQRQECVDVACLTERKLEFVFQEAIELEDTDTVIELTRQCIEFRKCPSLRHIFYALTICAQAGDKKMITEIAELYGELKNSETEAHSNFKHFLAEAIWVKGNIYESLKLYEEVYEENVFLRRRINLRLKFLIQNISSRSEAALLTIIKFCEKLAKVYMDHFPLTCVWQSCFLSEWFHDQRLALDLLERNSGLRRTVINRIPYVITVSLRHHRTEIVYRLLEVLLKYEMKLQYPNVLLPLLNYQICQRDIRSCREIISWSVANEVELPKLLHQRFLMLLLTHKDKVSAANKRPTSQEDSNVAPLFKF